MKSKSTLVIIVLIIIAAVLAFAIYKKYYAVPNASLPEITEGTTDEASTSPITTVMPELTADQKIMFNTPSKDATQAELANFSAVVARHAQEGSLIKINNCVATPDVLKIKYGSQFTVENTGTEEIHFGFGTERTLVPAGKSAVITANYKNGPGTYGYGCDSLTLNRAIGILLITQ